MVILGNFHFEIIVENKNINDMSSHISMQIELWVRILPVLGVGALAISKEQGFFVTAVSVRSHRKFSFSEENVSREADGTISIV